MADDGDPVLIDTSVWIDVFQGRTPSRLAAVREMLYENRVLTCGPVLFEIRRGLKAMERKTVLPLLEAVPRLDFQENDWDRAGDLDASLRSKGITLPALDLLIAQICLRHRVRLFTHDRHFRSVPGLLLFS